MNNVRIFVPKLVTDVWQFETESAWKNHVHNPSCHFLTFGWNEQDNLWLENHHLDDKNSVKAMDIDNIEFGNVWIGNEQELEQVVLGDECDLFVALTHNDDDLLLHALLNDHQDKDKDDSSLSDSVRVSSDKEVQPG